MRYLALSILIFFLFSGKIFAQGKYFGTHISVSSDNHKMIISDLWKYSMEGYKGTPISSKLYGFPLDCNKSIELQICDNYKWSRDDKYFAGDKYITSYNHEIFLYDSTGTLISSIKNGYVYSFVLTDYHFFYREYDTISQKRISQLIRYDYLNKKEIVFYTFGSDFAFYHPEDHDGFGYPMPLFFHNGGIRGVIYKITKQDEFGNILAYDPFTFIISMKDNSLVFWCKGEYFDRNRNLPEEGFIKNSN